MDGKIYRYVRARSLDEALHVLRDAEPPAQLLAGGTDLLIKFRKGQPYPRTLIDISEVPELMGIWASEAGLRIGAATAIADIVQSPVLAGGTEILAQAAGKLGSPQIRNRATIGGNLCNAAPSAEMAGPLLTLNAQAEIVSARGRRSVPLDQFFVGPGSTVLQPDEILATLYIPWPASDTQGIYIKHSVRKAMDLAIVGVSVTLSMKAGKPDTHIALGAVAPTPIRARKAEQCIAAAGRLDDAVIAEAALLAAQESAPISDVRASAEYRRDMVQVLTARALRQVHAQLM